VSAALTAAIHRTADAYDRLSPNAHLCAACDWPDARHRTGDAITDAWRAGTPVYDIRQEYGHDLTDTDVLTIVAATLWLETELRAACIPRRAWGAEVSDLWPTPDRSAS
jgi:hypothetical protein